MRTRQLGVRSNFTHPVETLDYQYRVVSCQLQDFVPPGLVDECFRQVLDELIQIEVSILELLRIQKGERNV